MIRSTAPSRSPKSKERPPGQLDLDSYQYVHSTRAELLRRLGGNHEARAAYARALELAETEPERSFLQSRLHELDARNGDGGADGSADLSVVVLQSAGLPNRARRVFL
jgi:hypothetical protein